MLYVTIKFCVYIIMNTTIMNTTIGGKKKPTLGQRINNLENGITTLSNLIEERDAVTHQSSMHCRNNVRQNDKLSFIVDAYNNSYMRIIDDKLQQMQHFAKLKGYLDKLIEDGNYDVSEIRRARDKQHRILNNINETRASLESIETLTAMNMSDV